MEEIKRSYERKTIIERKQYYDKKEKKYRTIDFERDISMPIEMVFSTPFANFHQAGKQRNKVKVWHEYEYNWTAYMLTKPKEKNQAVDRDSR